MPHTKNRAAIGATLKSRRTCLGLSQAVITRKLGYKTGAFVSMIEAGDAAIPMGRLATLIEAYQVPPAAAFGIIARLYPDVKDALATLGARAGVGGLDAMFEHGEKVLDELAANPAAGRIGVPA